MARRADVSEQCHVFMLMVNESIRRGSSVNPSCLLLLVLRRNAQYEQLLPLLL